MARGRLIARSLSTSERYARLHTLAGPLAEFCQAVYPLIVVWADDHGRLAGDPFTVKHQIVPTSPRAEAEVAEALEALARAELIAWYTAHGRQWIQIIGFDEHQPGLQKRTPSVIPEPPGSSGNFPEVPGTSAKRRETAGNSPSRARAELNRTELNRTEQKGTEGKGREGEGKGPRLREELAPAPLPPTVRDRLQRLKTLVNEPVIPRPRRRRLA